MRLGTRSTKVALAIAALTPSPAVTQASGVLRVNKNSATSARFGLYTLTLLLAGASLFALVALCTVIFLVGQHCGPAFGYYGCD
jgi:hypothetical protein